MRRVPFADSLQNPLPPTPTAPRALIVLMQTVPPAGSPFRCGVGVPARTAVLYSPVPPPLPSNATALAPGPSASPLAQGPFPGPRGRNPLALPSSLHRPGVALELVAGALDPVPVPGNGSVVSLPSPPPLND